MDISDHSIDTPHGRLFARRWRPGQTNGPTLLLFHDSLGCVELWRDFPADLATSTGLNVVAYDRLGFGRSAPHPGLLSPEFIEAEAAQTLPALAAALDIADFIAIGHSVGGGMAVGAAAAFPHPCRAVITMAAQSFVEDRTLAGIRAAQSQFQDPAQRTRLARYHGPRTDWVLDAWIGTWLSPAFAAWTLDDSLSRLRCPLLAIHGDHDEYGSPAQAQRIAALATNAQTRLFTPCGHFPHREMPGDTLAAIRHFLTAIAAPISEA